MASLIRFGDIEICFIEWKEMVKNSWDIKQHTNWAYGKE